MSSDHDAGSPAASDSTAADGALGTGLPQDDDYLATIALDAAKESLRNRLMAADPTLTAGAAMRSVEEVAEAAYATFSVRNQYEGDRLAKAAEYINAQAPTTPASASKADRLRTGGDLELNPA